MQAPKSNPFSSHRASHLGNGTVASEYEVYGSSKYAKGNLRPVTLPPNMIGQRLACDLFNANGILLAKVDSVISPGLQNQLQQIPIFCPADQAEKISGFNPVSQLRRIAKTLSEIDERLVRNEHVSSGELNRLARDLYDVWVLDADACLGYARLSRSGRPSICHVIHVALIAAELATANRLDSDKITDIIGGALTMNLARLRLHDEMYASDQRPDADKEFELHFHPIEGKRLLVQIGEFSKSWIDVVSHHHENIDGSGYPWALKGTGITLSARIVRIADIYAARLTGRKTRPPFHWNIQQTRSIQLLARHIFGDDIKNLDSTLVTQLTQALGCFPPGSLVRLNNNELAVVTRRAPGVASAPPQVHSIRDYQGQILDTPRIRRIGHREYEVRNYANEDCSQFPSYDWQKIWGYAA